MNKRIIALIGAVALLSACETASQKVVTGSAASSSSGSTSSSTSSSVDKKKSFFCMILDLIENKKIAKQNLKAIVDDIWSKDVDIKKIVNKYLNDVDPDNDDIDELIKKVILKNEKQVDQYKSGKTKIIGFFVGQVLKDSKGSDPSIIKEKIIKFLDSIWKN